MKAEAKSKGCRVNGNKSKIKQNKRFYQQYYHSSQALLFLPFELRLPIRLVVARAHI
jgi:hypothetical protein